MGHMGTADKWRERRRLSLQNATVYDSLDELIAGAKNNTVSLAVFKPSKVIDFIWEDDDPVWSRQRLEEMRALHGQLALFEDNSWRETFKVIPRENNPLFVNPGTLAVILQGFRGLECDFSGFFVFPFS